MDGFSSPVAPVDCIARKEKKNARNSANKISPTGMPNWLFMTTHAITSTTNNPGSHIHVATCSSREAGSIVLLLSSSSYFSVKASRPFRFVTRAQTLNVPLHRTFPDRIKILHWQASSEIKLVYCSCGKTWYLTSERDSYHTRNTWP